MKRLKNDTGNYNNMLTESCLPEWLPAIEANRQLYQYKKGEQLFAEGDAVKGMYFVQSGVVKVHKQWDADKELIIRFAKSGDIAGHRGLGVDDVYPVSATALENVVVSYFDMPFFNATLKVNHDFLYKLLMFFAAELKVSERKMRNLAHMPVKARVAQTFLNLYLQFGVNEEGNIAFQLARQDIASYAGTTYETVFRIINDMIAENLLEVAGKNIRLTDVKAMESLVLAAQSPVSAG